MKNKDVLHFLLKEIAEKLNLSLTENEAKEKKQNYYLSLEYSSAYGGYRVVNVSIETGGHYGALGGSSTDANLKAAIMEIKLRGILSGIELAQKNN